MERCRAIPSRRGVHEVRGVSHCEPKHISVAEGCVALSNTANLGGVTPSNIVNPGCVALSNWLSVGSGQSVVLLGGRCAQNLKKIFSKIIQICLILGLILADFEAARPTLSAGQAILSQRIDLVLKKCRFALRCCEKLLSLHILCCLAGKDNMLSK